jgi:hypothetical protein
MDSTSANAGSKPQTYNGDLSALPAALLLLCTMLHWVIWRWVKNGSDKWTKPPFQAQHPSQMARNNATETWSSHATAAEVVKSGEADGIGFVLTETDFATIDLDHCRDPITGKIDDWAQAVIDQASGAYCEVTVSGAGLRVIGVGVGQKTHTSYKVGIGQSGAKIEIFRRAVRYITVSGLQIGACAQLANIDKLIDSKVAQYGNLKPQPIFSQSAYQIEKRGVNDLIRNGVPEQQRSEAFQSVIFRLANAGLSIEEIEEVLAKYPNGIGNKYAGRLRTEIERSYGKWAACRPGEAANGDTATEVRPVSTSNNPHDWDDPDFTYWTIGVENCQNSRSIS